MKKMIHLKKKKWAYLLFCTLFAASCSSGGESEAPTPTPDPESPTYDMTGFARGADISWITEMEANGKKFYDAAGKQAECFWLMRELGVNAIRLRVWVNPADGWCNQADVVKKAVRAKELGFRLMIDFHYSDSWADPGKQPKPAAWKNMNVSELKEAIASHTQEVLGALKQKDITPEWIQIGNEVSSGMLFDTNAAVSGATWDVIPEGEKAVTGAKNIPNFCAFLNAGSAAARSVYPKAKIIVHIDRGENQDVSKWIADMLKQYNVDYDVMGVSLYPSQSNYKAEVNQCIANLMSIHTNYGKEVAVCEVGMEVSQAAACKTMLTDLMTKSKALGYCLGVFYWEPECNNGWNQYSKGAFNDKGMPTVAMDAFGTK